jgi:GT2 family glycosyltransferase
MEAAAPERFTVVVPTRNRPRTALELARYLRLELGWRCPIVLVDQSDDDGRELAAALRDAALDAVTHLPSRARGTGAARNAGVRAAGSEWLLFLDDDVRPAHGYLETLERYIDEHPWLDAVQPGLEQRAAWGAYQRDPEAWLRARRERRTHERLPPPEWWDGAQWFTGSPRAGYETHTIGVASGNLAIARAAYVGAGGFDEQIVGRGDDSEFGLRLWWYGYTIRVCPHAVAFHLHEERGGTRGTLSWRERLLRPEPAVGWLYLYLKWFPGEPFRQLRAAQRRSALRRPWSYPIKLLRFRRSLRAAEARLREGARLFAPPVPRDELHAGVRAPAPEARTGCELRHPAAASSNIVPSH